MTTPARRAGIDVGGTKLLGVVIDPTGAVVATERSRTPRTGQAEIIEDLVEMARALEPWDSLGVGMPGLVTRAGILKAAPNLVGASDLAVGPLMSAALGRPVAIDNDATCAAIAEWRAGAARGHDDVVLATLGTGIGGGLVSQGRLHRGANGFAGEIGHMVIDPDGPPCPCGKRGCWERFASGSALAAQARAAMDEGRLGALVAAGIDASSVRGEHVQDAARAGDPDALGLVDAFGRWVALGLVNLTNVFDPSAIVIGGGLASSPDLYLGPIEHWFGELLYAADGRARPPVMFAELGEHAGAIGAAMLPAEHAVRTPSG